MPKKRQREFWFRKPQLELPPTDPCYARLYAIRDFASILHRCDCHCVLHTKLSNFRHGLDSDGEGLCSAHMRLNGLSPPTDPKTVREIWASCKCRLCTCDCAGSPIDRPILAVRPLTPPPPEVDQAAAALSDFHIVRNPRPPNRRRPPRLTTDQPASEDDQRVSDRRVSAFRNAIDPSAPPPPLPPMRERRLSPSPDLSYSSFAYD